VKLIAGLGNPGVHYQRTRHNAGFLVVDRLAEINHILISHKRFKSLYGSGSIAPQKVVLLKPATYMNRSGEAVSQALHFFNIGIEDLIVVHDDLDLPFGKLRFKKKGGDGGHQGIRSIIDSTGGDEFLRLKVGIGRPPEGRDPADYVLDCFNSAEQKSLEEVLSLAAESIETVVSKGIETAMNRLQRKARTEE
jgi:PTH1 family peptidyl-tRNA hydrolase